MQIGGKVIENLLMNMVLEKKSIDPKIHLSMLLHLD